MAALTVQEVAQQIVAGNTDNLVNGTLFRCIRGVQSKVDLVDTPRALQVLSRCIQEDRTSNAALRAIAQAAANTDGPSAASRSEMVCVSIASVPGLLKSVVRRLETDVDAVRLVNNLVANSEQSAELFVSVPESVDALKASTKKFRLHSFGVINHLSRCPVASAALLEHGFVEEILYPALEAVDENLTVEDEATIARGTLALANLAGTTANCCPTANRFALKTIVKVLDHAVRGERLATITWLPPAVLFGLRNMTLNSENSLALLDCGIAPMLAKLIDGWVLDTGIPTLELSIESISHLSTQHTCIQPLWDAGVVRVLKNVSEGRRGESETAILEATRLVEVLMERHCAVCMGQHRRVGAESSLMLLDDAVVFTILQFSFGTPEGTQGPFHM
eukprot:CAMPEP_0181291150 /NCGR_PEP_ID=MMETSP1101-20121128/1809_1 /TAXON_ID=46948 /ORGANISM="Rhodomonas abbreviata, Strain Caron Lab Isolate" /LENGTH=391 /DNA_ID=CAMNT_0023395513 /DNA_START=191 /DNA_END=1366 /DNA_ORIENTATION=-